ncbi:efflux RND transporter periplasmic adaptor subunit [Rhodopirellula bahusiensis]|uniref:efflux RND transporter periplasmic adaptor subunit n=2 Tax=Rhodopirellula bahusiensis TaxID=2014065 RepID=UPI0032676AFC
MNAPVPAPKQRSVWNARSIALIAFLLTTGTLLSIALGPGVLGIDPAPADDGSSETATPRLHVRVAQARSIEGPELFHRYRGEVVARRDSSLAMRRGGRLTEVSVHEGDMVAKGDVLARIDVADLDAAAASADAEIAAAKAALDEAIAGPRSQTIRVAEANAQQLQAQWTASKNRFERQQSLRERGAGTQQELDDAKFATDALAANHLAAMASLDELKEGTRREQIAAAKARLQFANAARQRVEVDLSDSLIVAPFDGVIATRLFDEGSIIGPNQPVLRILEAPPVHATFGIPADVSDFLKVNDRLRVSVGEAGAEQSQPARVIRMQPQINPVTRLRLIEVELVNNHSASKLESASKSSLDTESIGWIGKTATLWVPWSKTETQTDGWIAQRENSERAAIWVPTSALVRGVRGLWSIYVAEPALNLDVEPGSGEKSLETIDSNTVTINRRDVKVIRTAGQMSLVSGPIAPTEAIVIEGTQRVGPGVNAVAVWDTPASSLSLQETAAQ